HRRNIAVILDVVYSHTFGDSPTVQMWRQGPGDEIPGYPARNNPYHNVIANHPFSVGENLNHCSPFTRYMVRRAIMFWIEEFRLDGFRFDLSKGFTQRQSLGNQALWNQFDQERINNLCWYASQVRQINPDAFLIMEHFSDRDEEHHMSWYCDLMFWRNTGRAFSQLAMGWTADNDISGSFYNIDNHHRRNFVSYMESHDEERLPFRILNFGNNYNPDHQMWDTTVMLQRMAATANIFFTTPPGPRMLWQFGEIGYHWPINFCYNASTGVGYLPPGDDDRCRTGRMPIPWNLLEDPRRQALFDVYSTLIHLRTTHPAFRSTETAWVGSGNDGRLRWTHARSGEHAIIAVSNLDVVTSNILVQSVPLGRYYNVFGACDVFPAYINITSGNWGFNNIPPGRFALFTRHAQFEVPDITVPPSFSLNLDANIIEMGADINLQVTAERHTLIQVLFNDEVLVATSQNTINHTIRQVMSVGENYLEVRMISDFGVEVILMTITVNLPQIFISMTPSEGELDAGSSLAVLAEISIADSLQLSHNNRVITTRPGRTLNHTLNNLTSGAHTISVRAMSQHYAAFSAERTIIVRQQPTSIEPEIVAQVDVFPNPVTDRLYIQSPDMPIDRVEVYDLRGRRVMEQRFDSNNISLDMSNLNEGIFILRIYTGEHVITQRIVKN
ncbi:MAG: T9SS type A sorting domain-containing protein, partial [Bacteroidales bacterium]|nr:T9SS type A sorting domain-containing protein [Bacteroidales bacterium]